VHVLPCTCRAACKSAKKTTFSVVLAATSLYLVSFGETLNTQPHIVWSHESQSNSLMGVLSIISLRTWGVGWGKSLWLAGCSKLPYLACGSHAATENSHGQTSGPHIPSRSPSAANLGIQRHRWFLGLSLSLLLLLCTL